MRKLNGKGGERVKRQSQQKEANKKKPTKRG